jgi:hypothetical protein
MKRLFHWLLEPLMGYCERHRRYGVVCKRCVIEAHLRNPELLHPGIKRQILKRIRAAERKDRR